LPKEKIGSYRAVRGVVILSASHLHSPSATRPMSRSSTDTPVNPTRLARGPSQVEPIAARILRRTIPGLQGSISHPYGSKIPSQARPDPNRPIVQTDISECGHVQL
jgi:hypothetical protein